jgi:hypothetical protein
MFGVSWQVPAHPLFISSKAGGSEWKELLGCHAAMTMTWVEGTMVAKGPRDVSVW